MNFSLYLPTRVLYGKGQLNALHAQKIPGKKALIVISSGKSTKANGFLERVEKELDLAGVEHVLYDKVFPNPVLENVREGATIAKENGCDFVVGLGGGSTIDCAKSIAVMCTNPGDYWDYISSRTGKGMPLVCDALPIVAIPTTAGTGSEVDPWTVISRPEVEEKAGFGCDTTRLTLAIVDPDLTMSVPRTLTMYQGFDALFHATETYVNPDSSPLSRMFAREALWHIGKYLPVVVRDGSNEEARAHMSFASSLGGYIMMCGGPHGMEHALSGIHHDLAHGAGLIMITRAYNQHFIDVHACDELYVEMARALGMEDAKVAQDFITVLDKLYDECGANEVKMSDYGIKKDDLWKYIENARINAGGNFGGDPVALSDEELHSILLASYQ